MSTEEFALPTHDGVTQLRGDVISPDGLNVPTAALLMIPGGGFTERDGFLGDSYTDADLMFRRLAHRVVQAGFVVARYDNRGVTGHELSIGLTRDSIDPEGDTDQYFKQCVDVSVRRTVTPESLFDDAELVYRFVEQHPHVDASRIAVFAHSEAGIHLCRLIGAQRVNPQGIVIAGTPVGSPIEVLRWQMIDRYVEVVMSWDSDGDGRVSAADVASSFGDSFLIEVGLTEVDLAPPNGHWERQELLAFFTARHEEEKAKTLNIPDDAPYPQVDDESRPDFVLASNRWWKQWFADETSTLDLLRDFKGHLSFHFGEIDRQFSPDSEVERIGAETKQLSTVPKVTLHPGRGHAFATAKPIAGPMDQEAEDILVDDITTMLESD